MDSIPVIVLSGDASTESSHNARRLTLNWQLEAPLPTNAADLKSAISYILSLTEWPFESKEAVQTLLQIVGRAYLTLGDRRHDPPETTNPWQDVLKKVKEASLTYDPPEPGAFSQVEAPVDGGSADCTRLLTACREKLLLSIPEAGVQTAPRPRPPSPASPLPSPLPSPPPPPTIIYIPPDIPPPSPPPHPTMIYIPSDSLPPPPPPPRSRLLPPPLLLPPPPPVSRRITHRKPLPPTLGDDESQQQSSSARAQGLASRPAPLVYDSNPDAEQQRVRQSSVSSAVSISSTKATLGPNTVVVQQEAVPRAPTGWKRLHHRPPPLKSALWNGESRQHSSSTRTESLEDISTLSDVNGDADSEEEELAVSSYSSSRQAPTLRGDERQQHRSNLRVGSSAVSLSSPGDIGEDDLEEGSLAPSRHTHMPRMGIVEEDSDKETLVPPRHMLRRGIIEDGSDEEAAAPSRYTPTPLICIVEADSEESLPLSSPWRIPAASEEPQLAGPGEEGSAVSGSSSIASSGSVADVGAGITWISPMPIKVNGHSCTQQPQSSLRAGRSAVSASRHNPFAGTSEEHSDIEYVIEPSSPSSSPRMSFAASDGLPWAGLGEEGLAPPVRVTTASLNSIADVGTQITWISPTPVKVNGHFCDVFEGTHSKLGKVALERPKIGGEGNNVDVMRRLQREAETWGGLQHPHILAYLGTFQRDGHFYFVSPFTENGTLVEYIAGHPSVNRIKLLCETADAISYLHKEDVVHGNIKASSFFFGDNGQVLLCASAGGLTIPADVRTSTDVERAGTLRWQSPELLEGGSKSFKSDVFAFGMTIAEVLTGDVPFPDLRTDRDVINAVLIKGRRPPRNPTGSSAGLSYRKVWAVAKACWRTIPEKRISMSEAFQMLQKDPALTVTQADPALSAIQDTTSASLIDVGSFITSISNDAVRLNGHFCDVFEGIHSTAGRVALKRPRIAGTGEEDGTMRRFEREAVLWQRLRHPHILEFLGTFRRNRHLYLVSRFVNNGTLVEYTTGHPRTNRIRLLCETADALNYLHDNDIVHGDIKGTNILIDDNIHCLLCDFGLSKMTPSTTSTTMRGAGTSRWQSPELLLDAPKSFSSDAYAFAMTIVEVLTGEAPFAHITNDTLVTLAVVYNNERPPRVPSESLSGVSYLGAWDVAEACWSANPEERISMSVAFQRLQVETRHHRDRL